MSLFKIRDWWSTSVGEEEEFDNGCLCVGNVDNDAEDKDKIVIGSFHGLLRIYNPNPTKTEAGWSGFRPQDVLVEHAFSHPILQVEIGRFSSGSAKLYLAILHPKKLAVYNVTAVSGAVGHGQQYQFNLLYEHALQRTACNITFGSFGGVKGKDFLCVQSMDGTLSVFEQETFAFSRFLPGALLPGPVKYIPRTDSFVTVSSLRQVECYKYQVLAVSTDSSNKDESQNIKSGKKVSSDWTFNIGEQALDISVITFPQAPPSILILGERNLFCLTETGTLRYMKKFEFDPACFIPYASLSEGTINYMIATHSSSLMVYQDVTLKWAAKMEHVPVQIRIGNFTDLKGVVVTLNDTGQLMCGYLGTDPAIFVPPSVDARDINYADMDNEMRQLQKQIREKSQKAVIMPHLKTDDDLQITVFVNPHLDDVSMAADLEYEDPDKVPSVTARIQLKAKLPIQNVKLEVHTKWPLVSNQTTFSIPSVDPNHPIEKFCALFLKGRGLPVDLVAQMAARYTTSTGAPRVVMAKVKMPFNLVVKSVLPVKQATHKLTIDTNKPPVNLNELFPGLLGENAGGQGVALGFQFYGGPVITILASKTSQRYRLQCDYLEAMWLPLRELTLRLNNHFNRAKDFKIFFDGALPIQEYFDLIDNHFEYRLGATKCRELLDQRAQQFRSIQKRLLTKFKDKNPSPLQNLDTLLEGTYRQVLALADAVEDNSNAQQVAANNLSSGTYLVNLLIKLWMDLTDEEFRVLESTLSPIVNDSDQQGWQETVDASVTHILRTTLAKSAKDQSVNPSPLTMPSDTTKVKKHIALLCDRLGKGARLVEGLSEKRESKLHVSAPSKSVVENGELDSIVEGNEMMTINNTKYREKKKKKRQKDVENSLNDLKPIGLPALDRSSGNGLKQKQIESLVPDLDDMDNDEVEGPNISSTAEDGEVVYSL
ncbi:protein PTHB1-like [Gigantopelta aegis]|uniref:protein PTHB1-like n=1 Tax=Gigantopelta aegis TaxID=1735272 RepID=UPI001B889D82|nr:protein PTHB1-like [Gigantopelta aegis]